MRDVLFIAFVMLSSVVVYLAIRESIVRASFKSTQLIIENQELINKENQYQSKVFYLKLDSLKSQITTATHKIDSFKLVNEKLAKQNAKLSQIYNSVRVDMPDF